MAEPTTKAEFKSWCKRKLGYPAIDINVDDDQVDDRVDEAIQFWNTFMQNGQQRTYLKHQLTQEDVDRSKTNETSTATDSKDSSITASFSEGKGFIPMPQAVVSVLNISELDKIDISWLAFTRPPPFSLGIHSMYFLL